MSKSLLFVLALCVALATAAHTNERRGVMVKLPVMCKRSVTVAGSCSSVEGAILSVINTPFEKSSQNDDASVVASKEEELTTQYVMNYYKAGAYTGSRLEMLNTIHPGFSAVGDRAAAEYAQYVADKAAFEAKLAEPAASKILDERTAYLYSINDVASASCIDRRRLECSFNVLVEAGFDVSGFPPMPAVPSNLYGPVKTGTGHSRSYRLRREVPWYYFWASDLDVTYEFGVEIQTYCTLSAGGATRCAAVSSPHCSMSAGAVPDCSACEHNELAWFKSKHCGAGPTCTLDVEVVVPSPACDDFEIVPEILQSFANKLQAAGVNVLRSGSEEGRCTSSCAGYF